MTTLNVNITMEQFITMFQQFSKREQKKIVEVITKKNDYSTKLSLTEAATLLKADYETDKDLIALTTLDSEDFYEAK